MRYTKISLAFVATCAVLVAAACASTEDIPPPDATGDEDSGPPPSTVPKQDSGTPAKDSSAPSDKKCVAKCTQDSECAASCPPKTNAIHCCDVTTGTCYANASGTCPAPEEDSGTETPTY